MTEIQPAQLGKYSRAAKWAYGFAAKHNYTATAARTIATAGTFLLSLYKCLSFCYFDPRITEVLIAGIISLVSTALVHLPISNFINKGGVLAEKERAKMFEAQASESDTTVTALREENTALKAQLQDLSKREEPVDTLVKNLEEARLQLTAQKEKLKSLQEKQRNPSGRLGTSEKTALPTEIKEVESEITTLTIRIMKLENNIVSIGTIENILPLNRGGMSSIKIASCRELGGRQVAIKKLDKDKEGDFSTVADKEAILLGQINHPNVVRVYCFREINGEDIIVMELLTGDNLEVLMDKRGGELGLTERTLSLMQQAAEAVAALHEKNIVHRDLKPANFVVSGDPWRLKLIDLGLAKVLDEERRAALDPSPQTTANTIRGTPKYMPFEALLGTVALPIDIGSLALVYYQLLSGVDLFSKENVQKALQAKKHPHASSFDWDKEQLKYFLGDVAQLKNEIVPRVFPEGTPAELRELICRMSSVDYKARPTIFQVRDILAKITLPSRPSVPSPLKPLPPELASSIDPLGETAYAQSPGFAQERSLSEVKTHPSAPGAPSSVRIDRPRSPDTQTFIAPQQPKSGGGS